MFVACLVTSNGRILLPVDKSCSGMVSSRKPACTRAAKELSSTLGLGSHVVAWMGASSGTPGRGIHTVACLGASSGTLRRGIPRYSIALAQC